MPAIWSSVSLLGAVVVLLVDGVVAGLVDEVVAELVDDDGVAVFTTCAS